MASTTLILDRIIKASDGEELTLDRILKVLLIMSAYIR